MMPRLLPWVVLCWMSALAVASDELPAIPARLTVEDGDSIVFLGDSITHQCLYTQFVEDYFYTRMPHLLLKFHNSGVGGDRARDALIRFDRDVAAYKPKVVTILLGMNDGGVRPFDQGLFDTYTADMTTLLDKLTEIGATPVLIGPTMFDSRASLLGTRKRDPAAVELYNATLAYYGAWCREQALRRGLPYIDMYGPLNHLTWQGRTKDAKFTLIPDAVHPNAAGQLVMAAAWISDLGLPRICSTTTIRRGTGGEAIARAVGGKVSNAQFDDDGLEFTLLAQSLPWVLPEECEPVVQMMRLGHRLSREALEVHGLASGEYELTIDGQSVGTYSSDALEHGIELQDNDRTPQYAQARQVMELNRQRNDSAERPKRNLWRDVKVLRGARDRANANPQNDSLQQEVAALETKLEDFEAQLERIEVQAREIEDRIFEVNQPQPRRYKLVRQSGTGKAESGR